MPESHIVKKSVYQERGYDNRLEYLKALSEEYGVPLYNVTMLAQLLGPSEDFDGLVNYLEEYQDSAEWGE